MRGKKEKDITNMRFGRLIALHRVESLTKSVRWRFRCDCGCEFDCNKQDVMSGHTKSCGCLQKENNNKNRYASAPRIKQETLAKCAAWLKENTILPDADITRMIRDVSDEERAMVVQGKS